MCGFPSAQSVQLALLLAAAQGVGLLAAAPYFDAWGRRALLLPSALGAGAGLCGVSVAFGLGVDAHRALALGGLLVYLVAFGGGLAGGPWVVNAEVYPLRVRGLGQSAATTANWAVNYAVSATFLSAVPRQRTKLRISAPPPRKKKGKNRPIKKTNKNCFTLRSITTL
jgi:SP family galactose:H+ symporter-like MFS transporter